MQVETEVEGAIAQAHPLPPYCFRYSSPYGTLTPHPSRPPRAQVQRRSEELLARVRTQLSKANAAVAEELKQVVSLSSPR